MKPSYTVEYNPDSDFYVARCTSFPTLSVLDSSPIEALRRIIIWVSDRIADAD